jgi:AcrR family transcriptional regulator
VPRLWNQTIEAHRRDVRDALLETTWALVNEHGLLSVTMSQIAEETGVGRATLYKYFPNVEAILFAFHERHVADHLAHLVELGDQAGDASARLGAVMHAYARICHHRESHGTVELGALLHQGKQVAAAGRQLQDLFRDLLKEAAGAGDIRSDVAPGELAAYCVHALAAARGLPSEAAVRRLVAVTQDALRATPEAKPRR